MGVVRAGAAYFGLVFGAGFLLGAMRTLWIAPRVGERAAELAEIPVMIAVTYFAARWAMRRFAVPAAAGRRLAAGLVAFVLLAAAEVALVAPLRGMRPSEYFASRDPVTGSAFLASLGIVFLMPWVVARPPASKA